MRNILKDYLNPVFVETGTFKGDGIQCAKNAGFDKIFSIEISENLCTEARLRFQDDDNISIIQGDSSVVLWQTIESIEERITFMLDAHNLLYDEKTPTDKGYVWWPLMKELEIIAKHPYKDHTIIIDDVRLFDVHFGTSLLEVTLFLRTLNLNYQIYRIDGIGEDLPPNDVLIAEMPFREEKKK